MAELVLGRVLALLFCSLIFAQAFWVRSRQGSWLTPGAIFALYWGLMTAIPILSVQDAAPAAGTAVIFAMVSMFSIGTSLVPATRMSRQPVRVGLYDGGFLKVALVLTTIAALLCLVYNSALQGISLDRAFTFEGAAEYTENRYSGDLVANIFIQLATVLSYIAAVLCGLLLGGAGRWRPAIILLGLAPTLFVLVTQSAKGALLLSAALIAAGHFLRAIDQNQMRLISREAVRRLSFYALLILPLLVISFLARGLYGAVPLSELAFQLQRYFLSYSSGHLFAFNDWIQHYFGLSSILMYSDPGTKPGFYTFMSVFRALGDITPVPPGTYDEYYSHSDTLQTNVYTMFRGLIVDFSLIGAMIFMLVSGVLAKIAYRSLARNEYHPVAVACYIVFIAATQQSTYISLFQYNSAYAFGAVLVVLLTINHMLWKRKTTAVPAAEPGRRISGRPA